MPTQEIHIPIGAKVLIQKSAPPAPPAYQKAQVLALKPPTDSSHSLFYVHYDGFNKRLDEWVSYSLVKLDSVELPRTVAKKKASPASKASAGQKRKRGQLSLLALGKGKAQKQVSKDIQPEPSNASAENTDNEESAQVEAPGFSKEKEIEKLRTSGSMTQSLAEIARVKNIQKIQFGRHEIETW